MNQNSLFDLNKQDNKNILSKTFEENRKSFLEHLESPGKMKYKRFPCSPIRYAGGKTLAVGLIIEQFPSDIKKLASPFFGGGSIEIATSKLGIKVYGYEIFDLLVNYWQHQIDSPVKLYNRLKKFKPNREEFTKVKNALKLHWKDRTKIIQNKFELAALFYFNQNTSYGPHFLGWPSDIYLNEKKYNQTIQKVKNFFTDNLSVKCASFEKTILKHKNDFLYCDPPYYLDGKSKTFVGMYPHRNFPIHHKGFKHELLADLLKQHKSKFLLSYNDCPEVRKLYKGFNMKFPKWQYTFGQGDTRIGKNRIELNQGSHIKKSHEILIYNY
jgi:DNA adenine methylase